LFAGLGLHFDDRSSIRPGDEVTDDQWDSGAFLEYSRTYGLPADRQVSAGLSADAVVDTRDSMIDPRRGWFAAASYRGLIKGFLGGSSEWQLLHIEGRTYAPLAANEQQRLAVWVFGDFALGGVAPYFDLPSTGMDTYGRSARGYAEGRFRGERLLYGEAEYRTTLTDNGLVGLVAFLNVTTVTNRQTGEQLFETAALGGGAGVRVLVNKRSRTNLCVDFGVGEGSRGVYLAVQEAF
jgi:outer membrane protein assembly factor BamA